MLYGEACDLSPALGSTSQAATENGTLALSAGVKGKATRLDADHVTL